ncbi:hypothetical protein L798_15719 [Zootermopsis nevadensis]|uniref:Uncharacterized protein n=1 Tax=Zootermopsis nevadensis TaxID=136037 RepID=A0A067QLQ0_ZOONE|nr:hypothetical protein L798_15719 [Zootermopsis nevadensis]
MSRQEVQFGGGNYFAYNLLLLILNKITKMANTPAKIAPASPSIPTGGSNSHNNV